ncbi:CCA tRNA nucleotidyltransferase [bacterium]|nr:CCA tRNA nucleotidyltransferase [bacterium]
MLQKVEIPHDLAPSLKILGNFFARNQTDLYLVGGPVRDLLLGLMPREIDLLVVGDAAKLCASLKESWTEIFVETSQGLARSIKMLSFKRYNTVKFQFADPWVMNFKEIDFASSRRETYPEAGLPPIVFPGNLTQDLARRDFTINAMALSLKAEDFTTLVDLHAGQHDLQLKVLRVLHDQSFVDDPARLLRGIRFATRLGFSFATETEDLFTQAVNQNFIKRLPPERIFSEFRKCLEEERVLVVLKSLAQRGILKQILPQLDLGRLDRLTVEENATGWLGWLAELFKDLPVAALLEFLLSGKVSRSEREIALDLHGKV